MGCFGHALYGGKVVIGHAGGGGEGNPVGCVQVEQLGGFCHGEDLQLAVVHQVTLFQEAVHVGGLFLIRQVGGQIHDLAELVEVVGHIRIAGVDVGQGGSAHFALGSGQHVVLKVRHAALVGAFDHDVLFLPDGGIEFVHQLIEAGELVAAVVGPDGNGGGCLGGAAATHTAQQEGSTQCDADQRTKMKLHTVSFPCAGRASPARTP